MNAQALTTVRDEYVAKVEQENELLLERIALLEAEVYGRGLTVPLEWCLTTSETKVFGALVQRELATKELIMTALYRGLGSDEAEIKIVDVFIYKMRKKLDPFEVKIHTVWGQGYRLDPATREKFKIVRPVGENTHMNNGRF